MIPKINFADRKINFERGKINFDVKIYFERGKINFDGGKINLISKINFAGEKIYFDKKINLFWLENKFWCWNVEVIEAEITNSTLENAKKNWRMKSLLSEIRGSNVRSWEFEIGKN